MIGAALIIAMLSDRFMLVALLLALPGVLFLLAGSPLRVLSVIIGLQIVLTVTQLSSAQLYIGFMAFRVDDLLAIWLFWLWLLSLPDKSMKDVRVGPSGYWIGGLLILLLLAVQRGFSAGNNPEFIGTQIKTYGAYLFYFPLLWVLASERSREVLWKVLVSSAALGGFVFMLKGLTGAG